LLTPTLLGVPALIVAYLAFSLFCYLMPIHLLLGRPGSAAAPAGQSRRQARPWLVGASAAMLLAGLMLTWTALWALGPLPKIGLGDPTVEQTVKLFDVTVSGLVGIAITLLGRAIVAYEVFTGRPLPRNRFFQQWRGTALLAAGFGSVAAALLVLELRPIYSLMLAVTLMALFYALYSWRSYAERETFMAHLRPFLTSQNLVAQLTHTGAPDDPAAERLFATLCHDILGVERAGLVPTGSLAALAGPLIYPPGVEHDLPEASAWSARFEPGIHCLAVEEVRGGWVWAVPLWGPNGLAGVLFLGKKPSGGPLSEEEVELAQTGGERLLDMQAGSEMARLSMELLRRRLAHQRVLEGQGRRVLHDEILPELHTAILYLGAQADPSPETRQAVETLSSAHRRIADLLRAAGPAAPARLAEEGLVAALQSLLATDLAGEFQSVTWQVQPQAEMLAREMPLFAAEVLYFAARELLRNAARYGRGGDPSRRLSLTISLAESSRPAGKARLLIADDGVGFNPAASGEFSTGTGSGLRLHSAMLAAVGATLEIGAPPEGGTQAIIEF
jgi:signal transduction histidine kinase